VQVQSFFRYPGGKSKLRDKILGHLINLSIGKKEYREPFFGGGGIGLSFIENNPIKKLWINDKDLGISCLWTAVIKYPELLKKLVENFVPSVEKFDDFKIALLVEEQLKEREEIVEYGFMKLAIHQISYSGLGTKSGGPLGGRNEKNVIGTKDIKYPIDCRWSPKYICKKIDLLSTNFAKFSIKDGVCTNLDFMKFFYDDNDDVIIYLDPPYYIKGNELYQYGFNENDHIRLAEALKNTKHQWLLSYDNCSKIRELYKWAIIKEIDVNYNITTSRIKTELLISSPLTNP